MSEQPRRPATPDLRISDADRFKVAEILRDAAGDGRIGLDELDDRLEQTWAAKTYADLVPITLDLPAGRASHLTAPAYDLAVPSAGAGAPERHFFMMSGLDRKGDWLVPTELSITCLMGGANLDMREARYAAGEVRLVVHAIMGGADITVGPEVDVIMGGVGIMGGFSGPPRMTANRDTPRQVLRIDGFALMGGVSVKRRNPRKIGRRPAGGR